MGRSLSYLGGEGGSLGEVVGEGGGEEVAIERVVSSQRPDKVGVCAPNCTTLRQEEE